MNLRRLGFAVITVAAFSPSMSTASPDKDSANACARAFATRIAAQGAVAPTYKLDYKGDRSWGWSGGVLATNYTFDLEARNAKTGVAIARARCSTNSRGTIIALSSLPLGTVLSAQLE
jgi:hypothetical protein